MSSITTTIPVGPAPDLTPWCMGTLLIQTGRNTYKFNGCANSSHIPPTFPSDYQTICCDDQIIDTTFDYWGWIMSFAMNTSRCAPEGYGAGEFGSDKYKKCRVVCC